MIRTRCSRLAKVAEPANAAGAKKLLLSAFGGA
jgi:hypothetical protein